MTVSSAAITERARQIRQELPDRVRLVAVSKTMPAEAIRAAHAAGIRDFGENFVQEAASKQQQLSDLDGIRWHLVGHLQRNKVKQALQHFHCIQSCDSLRLAQRLDRVAGDRGIRPPVCLQVKPRPDPNKYGWTFEGLWADLAELDRCRHLDVCGLMAILPLGLSQAEALEAFRSVRALADRIASQQLSQIRMQELSMGMSADYPLALQAGTTVVRLGQTIFGARS
ncbi:MAG: YggS family pyridoxal phosphate-dependent enzyme [Cyanobacteria bacterium QS_8_64_29]|nr:MAG: YggS family pyridoxal phosphate-dependent enzyme [Cyanobacteria bacterium QS_8_64_29]